MVALQIEKAMKSFTNIFKTAWKEVAVKFEICCQFLWTCKLSVFFCHHPAPEKESNLSEKPEMILGIQEHIDTIPYLPEDLICRILVRLPAEVLYKSARLVCKHWACIVHDPHFIEAHLQQSKDVLFIESVSFPGIVHILETRSANFILTEQRHRCPGKMLASCDGVALFYNQAFYVANPATMEVAVLLRIYLQPTHCTHRFCIARVHSTGQYKVVHSCEDIHGDYHWSMLTVGVDVHGEKLVASINIILKALKRASHRFLLEG